jgi:anti-sigma factor RsiW
MDHWRAYELLPWFVNDTLPAAEREAVELHARNCITCRREVKEQQVLSAALRTHPTVHLSAQNAIDRLDTELDEQRRKGHPARETAYAPLLRFGVVAALGVALVGTLLWFAPAPQRGAGYNTLATDPGARAAQLDLVFTEKTTAAEMQVLLDAIGGEIVAGPSDVGRYGVRLTRSAASDADLAILVEQLGSDPHVRFAARAYTESER